MGVGMVQEKAALPTWCCIVLKITTRSLLSSLRRRYNDVAAACGAVILRFHGVSKLSKALICHGFSLTYLSLR
jgi:hypothetical protein